MAALLVSVHVALQDAFTAKREREFDAYPEVANLREGALVLAFGLIAESITAAFALYEFKVKVTRVMAGGLVRLQVRLPNGDYLRPGLDGPEFGEILEYDAREATDTIMQRADRIFEERMAALAGKPITGNPEQVPFYEPLDEPGV